LNPWGPEVDDVRSARLALLVRNSVVRKGKQPVLEDFLFGKPFSSDSRRQVQSESDMRAVFLALEAQGFAKREVRGDGNSRKTRGDPDGENGRVRK